MSVHCKYLLLHFDGFPSHSPLETAAENTAPIFMVYVATMVLHNCDLAQEAQMGGPATSTTMFIIRPYLLWAAPGIHTMASPFLQNIGPLIRWLQFINSSLEWPTIFRSVLQCDSISTQSSFLPNFLPRNQTSIMPPLTSSPFSFTRISPINILYK